MNDKGSKERVVKKMAYIQSLENGTTRAKAAKAANVNIVTVWQWAKDDKEFAKGVETALESRIKVVEDALFKLASGNIKLKNGKPDLDLDGNVQRTQGNVIAMIFYLKNRGKGRWTERTEVEFIAPKVVKRNAFIQAGEEPVIKEEEEVPEKETLINGDRRVVLQLNEGPEEKKDIVVQTETNKTVKTVL